MDWNNSSLTGKAVHAVDTTSVPRVAFGTATERGSTAPGELKKYFTLLEYLKKNVVRS